MFRRCWRALAVTVTMLLMLSGFMAGGASAQGGSKPNGMLTVLIPNGSWPGLDAATDLEQQADSRILNDIDGQLFQQAAGGKILPDLATGWKVSKDGKTVTIILRHGVKFQDGTPFNAQAVAYNINRDLDPKNACLCLALFGTVKSVTASGTYDVVIHLSQPYSPLIPSFINQSPNEPQSPTAIKNESPAAFAQHPIGAGPFEIVSMVPNTKVVLKANPNYWNKGQPHLAGITFESASSDQTDYEAVETGAAQSTNISTTSLAKKIEQDHSANINVYPSPIYYMISLNTSKPPFNNILVREVLNYATNDQAILKSLFNGIYPGTTTFCTVQTQFCPKNVQGYEGYNPAKAKQLMAEYTKQTGQPFPTIPLVSFLSTNVPLTEALAAEYKAIGINTTITINPTIPDFVQAFKSNSWPDWVENAVQTSSDPATGTTCMFGVHGVFTGVSDQKLQGMMNAAAATGNPEVRAKDYQQIFNYMAKMAYAVPLYQSSIITVFSRHLKGIPQGLSKQVIQDFNLSLS
jgi:ABC-type transport system substrate-binding protein